MTFCVFSSFFLYKKRIFSIIINNTVLVFKIHFNLFKFYVFLAILEPILKITQFKPKSKK